MVEGEEEATPLVRVGDADTTVLDGPNIGQMTHNIERKSGAGRVVKETIPRYWRSKCVGWCAVELVVLNVVGVYEGVQMFGF